MKLFLVKVSNIFFGLPIYLLFNLVSPIITIRIGRLYSSRIGHLNYNIDNYLYKKKNLKIKEFSIFVCEKYISNYEVYKKWNEIDRLLLTKNFFYKNLIGFVEKFIKDSKMLILFRETHHHTFASSSDQNMIVSNLDMKKGMEYLSNAGIKKPYICFHNRDSSYLSKTHKDGGDGNDHEFRDSNFDDFKDSIELLSKQKIQAVRIGEYTQNTTMIKSDNLISAVGKLSNEYLIPLIYHADYAVVGTSGINQMSKTLRKPLLLVNYIPLHSEPASVKEEFLIMFSPNTLIVPKKIYNKDKKAYLSLKEMLNLEYDYNKKNFFKNLNLEIIDNTSNEILDAVSEMNFRINNIWSDSKEQIKLQNKFWDLFKNNENYYYLRYVLKNRISSTYLSKNSFLLD